jgi:hypothetical protein
LVEQNEISYKNGCTCRASAAMGVQPTTEASSLDANIESNAIGAGVAANVGNANFGAVGSLESMNDA